MSALVFGSQFCLYVILLGYIKFYPLNLGAAISFMITSSIWGIFAAWLLYKMDERYSAGTEIQDYKPRKIQRANHSLLPHPTNKNLIKKVEKPKKINVTRSFYNFFGFQSYGLPGFPLSNAYSPSVFISTVPVSLIYSATKASRLSQKTVISLLAGFSSLNSGIFKHAERGVIQGAGIFSISGKCFCF